MGKHWEAVIEGTVFKANTLKELAHKLQIKPTLIEGVYYRSRLQEHIKIKKVVEEKPKTAMDIIPGDFFVRFD
jgi:hypothetical protein